MDNRSQVQEFHKAFGLLISNEPYINIFQEMPNVVKLRYNLIHEEFNELLVAIEQKNLEEVIDALMDILYVLYGGAVSYGIKTLISNFNSYSQTIYDFNFHKTNKVVQVQPLLILTKQFAYILEKLKNSSAINDVDKYINELIVLTYYMCLCQGFDVDYCFSLVHKSNMSKLCATEELAKRTVDWYKNSQTVYDSPNYRYNDELKLWVVYNESSGKILKSIEYQPVSFKEYLSN